jgi:hypothetical protein
MSRPRPRHGAASADPALGGVEGNSRLTSGVAAIIFVLLAVEGVTVLSIEGLFTPHVFVGVLLIAPVLVKLASTSWRFARYYTGHRDYQEKGPPHPVLRLLGPVVVVLTIALFASGVALLFVPRANQPFLVTVHQASFVLWFGAMSIHVIGHLVETATLAPRDWLTRTRRDVDGATWRQWLLAASLVLGVVAAWIVTPHAAGWWTQFKSN